MWSVSPFYPNVLVGEFAPEYKKPALCRQHRAGRNGKHSIVVYVVKVMKMAQVICQQRRSPTYARSHLPVSCRETGGGMSSKSVRAFCYTLHKTRFTAKKLRDASG